MATLEKNTEKLAGFAVAAVYLAIIFFVLRYFGAVVGYVVLGLVVALISKPLKKHMGKLKIRGKSLPDTFLAIISILVITGILCGVVAGLIPVFKGFVHNLSFITAETESAVISSFLSDLNRTLIKDFHLGADFRIESIIVSDLASLLNVNLFGNVIGTVASTFAGICVCLVSAIFIAFFLIKDDTLFYRFLAAVTPDRYSGNVTNTMRDVEYLLSRYFIGLLIEMTCIGLFDFLGLWLIAGLDVKSAMGIGFLAGLLNIIPYIGPLLGATFGTLTGIMLKFCSDSPVGVDVSFWVFVLILVSIFILARTLDNFVLMPVIYSTSIKAHPLEIFIVILLSAYVGGIIGMLLAMPTYTVLRVMVINFFPDAKISKALK